MLLLKIVLLIFRGAAALGGSRLGEILALIVLGGTVNGLLEDGLGLVDVKLGLEVAELIAAAIGATSSMGKGEILVVLDFLASVAPVWKFISDASCKVYIWL